MQNKKNVWIASIIILGLLLLIGPVMLKAMLWGISLIDCVSLGDAIVYGILLLALCAVGGCWVFKYLYVNGVKKEMPAEPAAAESDAAESDAAESDAAAAEHDAAAAEHDAVEPDAAESTDSEYELKLSSGDKTMIWITCIVVGLVLLVYAIMLLSLWADGWLTNYIQWMEDFKTLLLWGRVTGAICMAVILGWFAHIIYLKNQEGVREDTQV